MNIRNPNSEDDAFKDYSRHGVTKGTPLSRAAFSLFWSAIAPADRMYWSEQFERGPTALSAEFVQDTDTITIEDRDRRTVLRICAAN